MRPRLFWKILFAFGLTVFCITQGLWLLFVVQRGAPRSPEAWVAQQVAPPILSMLAHRVETDGLAGYAADRGYLPPDYRAHIGIAGEGAALPSIRGEHSGILVREASAPDGRHYRIFYRYAPNRRDSPLNTPWQVLVVVVLGGLSFSVILAWYLTKPIKLLRDGFNRMAQGDFSVRLQHQVGRRRDEIANLAQHFDLMAARLGQLVTARDRLLHDVSHELRSPLSRLQLAIGLARQDPQRLDNSLDRIEREASRLDAMVQELLILARAESGAEQADDYFDPVAALEGVFADARFEAQANGARIDVTLPDLPEEERPSVKGSAELFRRAIENVIRNALRFSPQDGIVDIRVDLEDGATAYRFRIADQGPGVSAADVETLFDPFVRADVAGFGLGLAIARRAILAHDGTITATNRPEGGLLVDIRIPTTALT